MIYNEGSFRVDKGALLDQLSLTYRWALGCYGVSNEFGGSNPPSLRAMEIPF